jgi:acyl-CoA dehydrogenase family member 9
LADIAIDVYASACTLSRLDHLQVRSNGDARQARAEVEAGRYFLALADRRMVRNFEALKDNDDARTTSAADAAMDLFG